MALIFSTLFLCSFSHFMNVFFCLAEQQPTKSFLILCNLSHMSNLEQKFLFYTCDVKMILSGDTLNAIRKKFIVEASIRFREAQT